MKNKIIIAAVCALGVWTILGVTHNISQPPARNQNTSDENTRMKALTDQAQKRAAGISPQTALSHLSLSEGVELGKILLQTYPNLTPGQLQPDLIRQGITDAITQTPHPAITEKSQAYTLAAARILAAKLGTPLPEPAPRSREEQTIRQEAQALSSQISEEEAIHHFSYTMGTLAAKALSRQIPHCTPGDIDAQAFIQGLESTLNKETPAIFNDQAECLARSFALAKLIDTRNTELSKRNQETGQAYLKANAARQNVITTPSGLQYRVITPGTGPVYSQETHGTTPNSTITYEIRRTDGSLIDSSGNTPVTLPICDLIPGMSEALKQMPTGAEWEITLPPELGYGSSAPNTIGPNATLIIDIKLHNITRPANTPAKTPPSPANPGTKSPS